MKESDDIMRLTLRLNQRIPAHARIISVLKDLNKDYHTTLNGFVIEALTYYIENISLDTVTNAGKAMASNEARQLVTESALEKRLDQYDQALKRWLLDCLMSFSGANRFPSPFSTTQTSSREGDSAPKEYDLTDYPDIMKDITAWSED